jgi:very-short-patch-repair endonuclease
MSYASRLRNNQTDAEKRLWHVLRNRRLAGLKFRRQFSFPPYIVDFVCLEHRIIVEVDGGQHAENVAYDSERTQFLEGQGYRVLRFWNNDVLENTEEVLNGILKELNTPHPSPLPQGARE